MWHLDSFELGMGPGLGGGGAPHALAEVQWALQLEAWRFLVAAYLYFASRIIWLCKMTVIYHVTRCNWGKYYSRLIHS